MTELHVGLCGQIHRNEACGACLAVEDGNPSEGYWESETVFAHAIGPVEMEGMHRIDPEQEVEDAA